MSDSPPPRRHTGTWIVVAILLAAALVGTLWVPFYARMTPAIGGFPFFYWYQLMWVPIVAVLSTIAYLLTKAAQRGSGGESATAGQSAATSGTGEAS